MSKIAIGDTVAFRRAIVQRCTCPESVAAVRGTVNAIAGDWLFMTDTAGYQRVMPMVSMCKVARSGVVLELV